VTSPQLTSAPQRLRCLLAQPGLIRIPGCFDALSARLIELAGFDTAFMSGFAVAGARLALPDTGLISVTELLEQGRAVCGAVSIPVFGDGDTGFGNALNVKRTVRDYARAGFAAVMIEDQVMPKRCGHTQGKTVADREEALIRIQAAVDARDEGADILILGRTDARATHGMDEAITRARSFAEIGADMVFLEAPETVAEMRRFCSEVPGPKLANMLEHGRTPILPPAELEAIGYKLAAYPLTLFSSALGAMQRALQDLKHGSTSDLVLPFETIKEVVGFSAYTAQEQRYRSSH